tara:strand:- start:2838 stop:3656 length:819 start_codon:yes stop_codon:yes gene_type:complete
MYYIQEKYINPLLYRKQYLENKPFKHIILDDFINPELLNQVEKEFPDLQFLPNKITFDNQKEIKFASKGTADLSPKAKDLIGYLNSDLFLDYLQNLTGIDEKLISDPYLTGAGYHQIKKGGLLKIHADFNKHGMLNLDRRINLLIYLNKNWNSDWGGNLELYDKNNLKSPVVSVEPKFNRCLIFSTTSFTYHGHPDKLRCPENRSRRSIALYYFSTGRPKSEIDSDHGTLFIETKGEKFKYEYKFNLKGFIAEWIIPTGFKKLIKILFKKYK